MKLKVEGMSCGHCEKAVREALAAVPGVEGVVRVSAAEGEAEISGQAEPRALVAALDEQGFDACVEE
ncbi:heavy-metal-associated domain-containing protein [Alkalilimnicola ehrlichii MLHE-1]|uniref:Heavy metal transport/detoxification protein n=1 Tax=Alkalilimnicola ehrlichii (strain ATCC BAA-1101 / DSM 17681 / MLHE-1) TaxID=187272 RepID=Q0ABV9_ALKEH|nr:cation transporter [Alkalilimnicola ehrlichii]ABI55678.1 Heavy metal transport/detoxification protein [Alkalilimnicola ehrlichii MLHE-1]